MSSVARTGLSRSAVASWVSDAPAGRLLRYAAVFYGLAWAIHTGDHLRRGFDAVTTQVTVLGTIAGLLQLAAVGAVLWRWRWAPIAAVAVGFPDAIGIAAVHLLPHWSSLSDAFPGTHGAGVTPFSWVAAILEISGALVFGLAGANAWGRSERALGGAITG